uniref:B3 domain-containing protein Os11g0197600-like isoform X2 n=1 Tax=Fragaria vesca subsp. vesca TaxID=101020 RepID=UPI0005C806AF|nr:PREDICTED: B3 domain-containing protein Os11g0197600-like isoform X2 [Fragaria vesca subsp. vesca]
MVRPKNGIKEKRPSFFKVIIPGYSTRYLRIPPPFLELISNDLSGEATLNSNTCSEWSWNVGVTKTIRSVYFKDGWQEFLKDNSVEDGDFVVFEYEGNMNFNVQIFDNSGCERDCFPNIGTPKISSFAEKKRHPSTPRKSDICCSKCHLQLNSRKDSSESFKSNYPHVTLAIKKTYCVYSFPTSFYKEHLSPGNYEVVFLKIAEGKKWYKVKLVRSIATAFMSKGWSKFARANQIKVGNVCAFEVVEENKLVVHIIQD